MYNYVANYIHSVNDEAHTHTQTHTHTHTHNIITFSRWRPGSIYTVYMPTNRMGITEYTMMHVLACTLVGGLAMKTHCTPVTQPDAEMIQG